MAMRIMRERGCRLPHLARYASRCAWAIWSGRHLGATAVGKTEISGRLKQDAPTSDRLPAWLRPRHSIASIHNVGRHWAASNIARVTVRTRAH